MAEPHPAIQGLAADEAADREASPNRPLQITIVQSPAEAKHTAEREAASDEHEAKDLSAQVRAADAAEKQILPAWMAAFFSFLGTALIAWSIVESRDTKQRELRAYVVPASIGHSAHRDPKTNLIYHSFRVTWENRGATPARGAEISICSVVLDHEMPKDFDLTEFTGGDITIHQRGGSVHSAEAHISGAEFKEVALGSKYAYVWGSVRYRDVFRWSRPRATRFLYRVMVLGDPLKLPTARKKLTIWFPHMDWHNEAT